MADEKAKDQAPASSDSKTPEQTAAQQASVKPGVAAPPVELSHGEKSEATKAEEEAVEKTARDPWGDTPLQMRDDHSPEVDPELNDPLVNSTAAVRKPVIDAMEPGGDGGPAEGGTNAPA